MPSNSWEAQRKLKIFLILKRVKENPNITLDKLASMVTVKPPMLARVKALQMLEDLHKTAMINIDKMGVVALNEKDDFVVQLFRELGDE